MRQEAIGAVRGCYLFAGADASSVEALARASRVVRHPAGRPLFSAGDEADGLRILLSGLVRIWIADGDGRELTLGLMEPGDPFGEIALLDGLPRTASATPTEPGACLFLPARAMEAALMRDPKLARHLIQLLCELLRRNVETVGAFAFIGLGGRLAHKLHELALAHAELDGTTARFTRRFSQTDLAQMLGVTREAVNKRFKGLLHDGLVIQADGLLTIPDLPSLAARARAEARLGPSR
jgi:CRP-like cAMP-binding protein